MKSTIINTAVSFAVALSAFAAGSAISVGDANAKIKHRSEYINRDKCYKAQRVPATVEYNTMGKLLRASSRSWRGNAQRHGAIVVDKYHDPVYIQTRKVIEDQHVTLVRVKC